MAARVDFNARVIREFRENVGRVGGPFAGATMLILHSIGAKSGKERVTPLVYFPYQGLRYIVASAGGAPKHPAWYHNLKANPDVTIEISSASSSATSSAPGIGTEQVTAEELHGAEHDDVWRALVQVMPGFAEYQRNTTRKIPLLALEQKVA